MIDRGIIKWEPFDSCMSSSKMLKEVVTNKNKEIYPVLSEDQLNIIEEKINEAYSLKSVVKIKYYYKEKIYFIESTINLIDKYNKKIYLNNKILFFKQIIEIN